MLSNGRKRGLRRNNSLETSLNSSKADLGKQSSRHKSEEKLARAQQGLGDYQALSRFQTQDSQREHKLFNV